MDIQLLFNIAVGIIATFGGWIFKMTANRLHDLEEDIENLQKHHESDLKEVRRQMSELALSMPEKYVAKQDLDKLIDFINERFNKLENKIDSLKN